MNARQIYEGPVAYETDDLGLLIGFYFNHLPELGEVMQHEIKGRTSPAIKIKVHAEEWADHRRFYRIASVWYGRDDPLDRPDVPGSQPFMIVTNAGREGDDHADRWVTSEPLFVEAMKEIKRAIPARPPGEALLDPEEDKPELTDFYHWNGKRVLGHRVPAHTPPVTGF